MTIRLYICFFFNPTATTEIYTLSLHDALPITDPQNPTEVYWHVGLTSVWRDIKTHGDFAYVTTEADDGLLIIDLSPLPNDPIVNTTNYFGRSEEHTSELQSRPHLVCRLLLEK